MCKCKCECRADGSERSVVLERLAADEDPAHLRSQEQRALRSSRPLRTRLVGRVEPSQLAVHVEHVPAAPPPTEEPAPL